MTMRVHVVRERVAEVRWLEIGPDEMVFVLPDRLVTQEGADGLQDCWAYFIDKGTWVAEPGPVHHWQRLRARYVLSDRLGADTPAVVRSRRDVVVGVLSSAHFQPAAVASLNTAVADCIAQSGWAYRGRMRASA